MQLRAYLRHLDRNPDAERNEAPPRADWPDTPVVRVMRWFPSERAPRVVVYTPPVRGAR